MHVRVVPIKLGVVVMKNDRDINGPATAQIRDRRFIELAKLESATAFRPILQVQFQAPGVSEAGLIAVAKFEFRRNFQWVLDLPYPQEFARESVFYPHHALDLQPYRQQHQLEGIWELKGHITLIRQQQLAGLQGDRVIRFLAGLEYQEVATLQWEVILPIDERLDATGGFRNPRAQPEVRHSNVSVSLDEI